MLARSVLWCSAMLAYSTKQCAEAKGKIVHVSLFVYLDLSFPLKVAYILILLCPILFS